MLVDVTWPNLQYYVYVGNLLVVANSGGYRLFFDKHVVAGDVLPSECTHVIIDMLIM